jgi:pimeloyl-ACP methyl ester carboxylesterase
VSLADTPPLPEIRVNGVSLYHEVHGHGEPILCVHGTGSSAAAWSDALVTLRTRGRAIAYDRRGSSRSERPQPYATSVRQQAGDAAALIDALAAAPAIVIGRSYGADVAIELALRHPERVRALALLEGGESMSDGGRRYLAELGAVVLAAADVGVDAVAEALLRAVLGDATWEGLPEEAKGMFTANGPAIVAEFRGGFLDAAPEELAAIDQPTLLVTAEDSPPAFAEATAALASAIPSARVARVAGGHLIDPAGPAVLAFVDEVLAPP